MAAPRNVEYYISRISGYAKNTIRLQPVAQKTEFLSGDVIVFRLPTNAIIDLHTLTLAFDLGIVTTQSVSDAASEGFAKPPRYSEALFRRVDVTAGGVQVGLGSLTDYGSAFSFLGMNTLSKEKHDELNVLELGGGGRFIANKNDTISNYNVIGSGNPLTGATVGPVLFPEAGTNATVTRWQRVHTSMWLGVLGGAYMRFLDTNLMPDVEIRLTVARDTVLITPPNTTAASIKMSGPNMTMETISFGDNTYEQMVEARLSTGEPIVIPFINWASFETSATVPNAPPVTGAAALNFDYTYGTTSSLGTVQHQFTIATQSLNAVYGTLRAGDYDSIVDPRVTHVTSYITPAQETARAAGTAHGSTQDAWYSGLFLYPSKRLFNDLYTSYYYRFNAFDTQQPQNNQLTSKFEDYSTDVTFPQSAATTIGAAKFQMTIDSKMYPQYLADVADCYALTKNSFDGNGGNRDFAGLFSSLKSWSGNAFCLGISLDHNGEDNLRDRLVSGLK